MAIKQNNQQPNLQSRPQGDLQSRPLLGPEQGKVLPQQLTLDTTGTQFKQEVDRMSKDGWRYAGHKDHGGNDVTIVFVK
jgi:hypothetical protein